MFRTLSLIVVACVFGTALSPASPAADKNAQPNIVVILVDDMGYGDPGCFNPESKIPTPNINALAAAGMRFTDAHAPGPLCHLSRYGLMTGKYPFRAEPERWAKQRTITAGQMTIASLCQSQGYHTAMVGKWHLGFDEDGYDNPLPGGPIDCGFDSYFGIRASTDIPPYFYIRDDKAVQPPTNHIADNNSEGWSKIQGAFWRKGGIAPNLALNDVLPRFSNEAINVIESHAKTTATATAKSPLMLYLAYPAPHTPWLPSPEFAGSSGAGMYGDFLTMVDAEIGRVLASLRTAGMADDTLVVFTSDNGPVWYEADVQRFGHDSSGGFRGMKSDAWECGHRMPFIVRWPGITKPNSETSQLISFTDLLSTFAELLQVELPTEAAPDSFSFHHALTGEQPAASSVRKELVLRSGGRFMTFRQGPWKLIQGLGSGGFSKPNRIKPQPGQPAGQLYDLSEDPGETTDLYSQHPELVKTLSQRMEQIVAAQRHR